MQGRLILTSLLVSVLPMIIVAEITSTIIVNRFEANLENWLLEVSSYFLSSVKESQDEIGAVIDYIAAQPNWVDPASGHLNVDVSTRKLLHDLGYNVVALVDDRLHVISSIPEGVHLDRIVQAGVSDLYIVESGASVSMMSAAVAHKSANGKPVALLVGNWLDQDFMRTAHAMSSIDIELYCRQSGVLRRLFSSGNATGNAELPASVLAELQASRAPVLQRAPGPGYRSVLYRAMTSNNGDIEAVLSTRIASPRPIDGWISHTGLFVGIFSGGLLLSVLVGAIAARRLSLPLRDLGKATARIALGDFSAPVPVRGDDEVADLGRAFNHMVDGLKKVHALESELRQRDRFVALGEIGIGIAHEVRNPLGTIKTSAELVRRRGGLGTEDATLIGYVIDEVERIELLITNFLDFAKPRDPVLALVKVADVLTRTAEFFAPEFEKRHIDARIDEVSANIEIIADVDHVIQACMNIVLNALDAMPQGGTFTMGANADASGVRIYFLDSGSGVATKIIEKIFDPFFTTKAAGTGLGLAKVFSVMANHGGTVTCRNRSGHGAEFSLVFPAVGLRSAATRASMLASSETLQ